jgi:hypothetical protein
MKDADIAASGHFRQSVLARLEVYQSLYQRLDPIAMAQLSRPPQAEQMASNGGHGRPAVAVGVNVQAERVAKAVDIQGINVRRIASEHTPEDILASAMEAWGMPELNNPAGWVVKKLNAGEMAGSNYVRLARVLLQMSQDDYDELCTAETRQRMLGEWELDPEFYPELDEHLLKLFSELRKVAEERLERVVGGAA